LLFPQIEPVLLGGALNFLAATVILIIGWLLAGLVSRWIHAGLERLRRFDPTLKPLIANGAWYGIIAITVMAVLQRFGVQTTSLIAILGAAGLAIGLAIQGTLSNVASGVMLLVLRPFQIGDAINIPGVTGAQGSVREIGLFRTALASPDLSYVSIPNSAIFSGTIVNYTREAVRRIDFPVSIDYTNAIGDAENLIFEVLHRDVRVLKTPAPAVLVDSLKEYAVNLIARCWVRNADHDSALSDLQKAVKNRLHAAGVAIPVPRQATAARDEPLPDGNGAYARPSPSIGQN
jgi:small conductance mechanosensitive channel